MEKPQISRIIDHDYRISRTGSTIKIEVLDYGAEPLTLGREQLRELGLQLIDEAGPRPRRLPLEEPVAP